VRTFVFLDVLLQLTHHTLHPRHLPAHITSLDHTHSLNNASTMSESCCDELRITRSATIVSVDV
jgi:hypothetical protein